MAVIAAVVLLVGVAGCGAPLAGSNAPHSTARTAVSVRAPNTFVAVRYLTGQRGEQALTISSATTGGIFSVLLPDPWHGLTINSTAVDASGQVWVTLSRGPACTSGIAGCGPRPHSCASEVLRIGPSSGSQRVMLRAGDNQLIGDAQPSPDGKLLAYLASSCARSYFDQHLVVADLAHHRSWTIGGGLLVCHDLGSIGWTPSGSAVVVDYSPSIVPASQAANYGYGICQSGPPNTIAVVPILQPAPGLPGFQGKADPGCQIEAATPTAVGYAAIEACGRPDFLTGPARLLLLDHQLRIRSRFPIGSCVDGAELRADSSGHDLIGTTYQYCNPPGTQSQSVTFVDLGAGPKTIIDERNTGTISAISW